MINCALFLFGTVSDMSEIKAAEKRINKFKTAISPVLDRLPSAYSVEQSKTTANVPSLSAKTVPKQKEVIITQKNFEREFFNEATKKFVQIAPEILGAIGTMVKHPILTTGAIWKEVKDHPGETLKTLTMVWPLSESLVGEYKAYQLAGTSASNEEKTNALNESADKFGSAIFNLVILYAGKVAAKPVLQVAKAAAGPAIEVAAPVLEKTAQASRQMLTRVSENVKEAVTNVKLSDKAIGTGELVTAFNRAELLPSNSGGYFLGRIFGAKKVQSIFIIDVNDAKLLNDTYGKKAMDEAIKTVTEVTKDTMKVPGIRYGFEEQMGGMFTGPETVLKNCEALPKRISDEVLRLHGIKLTVKMGIAETGTDPATTIVHASRAAGASKLTGKVMAYTKDYGELFSMRGNWRAAAKEWAESNRVMDPDKLLEFVEKERGRIPLSKVFKKSAINETEGHIRASNQSALADVVRDEKPNHDPLSVLAPRGSTATKTANELSASGDYTVLKFSASLKGIDRLAPNYYKIARGGTLKFFNDGTTASYMSGDIHATTVLNSGISAGSGIKGFQLATRWEGLGDEITVLFKGTPSESEIRQYISTVKDRMDGALSRHAINRGASYSVSYAITTVKQSTPVSQALKETGERLGKLKAIEFTETEAP